MLIFQLSAVLWTGSDQSYRAVTAGNIILFSLDGAMIEKIKPSFAMLCCVSFLVA